MTPADPKDASEERDLDEDEELQDEEGAEAPPPIDFNTFILSLGTSAALSLGPDEHGQGELNLPMAKQSIDMLALLEEKTKGNLTGDEERLLAQILYELRLRYVNVAKRERERKSVP